MLWDVSVSRVQTATKNIRVEAETKEEAEEKARAEAGDHDFGGCATDYCFEINGSVPVENPHEPPNPLQDALNLPPGYRYLKLGEIVEDGDKRWEAKGTTWLEWAGEDAGWVEVPSVCFGETVEDEEEYIRKVPDIACAFGENVMPDDFQKAVEEGWIPSYYIGDDEQSDPVCPRCVGKFIVAETDLNLDGEYVSVWSDAGEVRSKCKVNPKTRELDIQDSDVNPEGTLVIEFVILNGKKYPVVNFDHWQKLLPNEQMQQFWWE